MVYPIASALVILVLLPGLGSAAPHLHTMTDAEMSPRLYSWYASHPESPFTAIPATGAVSFQIDMVEPGRARVEVFDARRPGERRPR